MSRLRKHAGADAGFTLVELIAAMTVFAIAAGAILTVLVAGIRTAGFSRDRTVAKDLARQRIEQMRSLPFFQSYGSYQRPVDVLDYYFPNLSTGCPNLAGASATSPGYSASANTFTCVVPTLTNYPRFGQTIVSTFVQTNVTGTMVATAPAPTYTWNSAGPDIPPTRFLNVTITTTWKIAGRSLKFQLESLLGESKLENILTQGSVSGSIFTASTAFSDGSTLNITAGGLSNEIYRGNSATARNDGYVATAKLVLSTGAVVQIYGAQYPVIAPPDTTQATKVTAPETSLIHPTFGLKAAYFNSTSVDTSSAKVVASLPTATGKETVLDSGSDNSNGFTSTNEVNAPNLDQSRDYLKVLQISGAKPVLTVPTCTEAATPKTIRCSSGSGATQSRFGTLRMIPINFSGISPSAPPNGYLVEILFNTLKVVAQAKAQSDGTATTDVHTLFDGTLTWYNWNGSSWVQNVVCIKDPETAGTSPCSGGIATALPALTTSLGVGGATLGTFIKSWSRLTDGTRSVSSDGTTVRASLNGVLSITTQQTNAAFPNTGYVISVGNMKAEAVDNL